ncbi:hypothetical protein DERF_003426 [Dermatophagoides farinae]|uniref:Uncharacterized protein n=1 Tax=Dermatophagoides farinae TaxID=6954 RepID=A0A922IF05_DERFA|nr:hypothetical protein DERF_003426 [Dermatophagoides farinae]
MDIIKILPFSSPEILAPAIIPVTPLNKTPKTTANDVISIKSIQIESSKIENIPPDGPKLLTIPSTQPIKYKALEKTLAVKNKVPMAPPNSGPKALLIITKLLKEYEEKIYNTID